MAPPAERTPGSLEKPGPGQEQHGPRRLRVSDQGGSETSRVAGERHGASGRVPTGQM